jgi:transcriptional regulator with XRE-family HTH domain
MARSRTTDFGRLVARSFGAVLRESRTVAYLSQDALAAQAQVDRRYLQLLEKGTSQPSIEMLFRLSRALKVEICDVMARTESLLVENEASTTGVARDSPPARARRRQASSKMLRRAKRVSASRSDRKNV